MIHTCFLRHKIGFNIGLWILGLAGIIIWGNEYAAYQYNQFQWKGYYQFDNEVEWLGYRIEEAVGDQIHVFLFFKLPKHTLPAYTLVCRIEHELGIINKEWDSTKLTNNTGYMEVKMEVEKPAQHFYLYVQIPNHTVVFRSNGLVYPDTRWISHGWVQRYVCL